MTEWNPVCRAMFDGDAQVVIDFCRVIFSLEIDEALALRLCLRWQKFNPKSAWNTSVGPAFWIKNRLSEWRELPPHSGQTIEEATTAIMHCFFISLQETHEILARLRNERPQLASVARSKVSSTPLVIQPIDATAAAVAPVEGPVT